MTRSLIVFGVAWIGSLLVAMLLTGCQSAAPIALPDTSPSQVSVTLDFRHHSEWTPVRRERAQAAVRLFETILNSDEFSRQITARSDLQRTEGLSTTGILRVIRSGHPLLSLRSTGAANKAIVLPVSIAPDGPEYAHHEGFTDLDTGIIYVRKDWLDNQSLCRLSGLFAHEYMHVIGFTHTAFNHPWLRLSVPYAVGDLVVAMSGARMGAQCSPPKK